MTHWGTSSGRRWETGPCNLWATGGIANRSITANLNPSAIHLSPSPQAGMCLKDSLRILKAAEKAASISIDFLKIR